MTARSAARMVALTVILEIRSPPFQFDADGLVKLEQTLANYLK